MFAFRKYSILRNDIILLLSTIGWSQGTVLKHMKKDQIGQKHVSTIIFDYSQDNLILFTLLGMEYHFIYIIIGTGTTPVHSPLPKDDPLFLLRSRPCLCSGQLLRILRKSAEVDRCVLEALVFVP